MWFDEAIWLVPCINSPASLKRKIKTYMLNDGGVHHACLFPESSRMQGRCIKQVGSQIRIGDGANT